MAGNPSSSKTTIIPTLPPFLLLDRQLQDWLREDIGRGDRSTQGLLVAGSDRRQAVWVAKAPGVVAGLEIAARVFYLLDPTVSFKATVAEGDRVQPGQILAELHGPFSALLMGERVALNLAMRLSGIATATRQYVEQIAEFPAQLVDTRKTTPGLRLLEKYATQVGGAMNHRMGLDDAVMLKDNHIAAVGGIGAAIAQVRSHIPYPLTIEVETENLDQVREAIACGADIIMLDNMPVSLMTEAVQQIRQANNRIKIEASGNVTLETLRAIAATGVDFISSSAPITRSPWLDLSMRILPTDSRT
jgi:nicotinate-nucleotide pyrophosphorylase (carboxylating)